MTRLRLTLLLVAVAALVGASAWLRPRPADAMENQALYVSGLWIGKGNRSIVRITNNSPHSSDLFSIDFTVRETSAGRRVNSFNTNSRTLFANETVELDIGAIVAADQAALGEAGNPRFKGPVQLIVSATGGTIEGFGPGAISAQAFVTEGKAQYRPLVKWVSR